MEILLRDLNNSQMSSLLYNRSQALSVQSDSGVDFFLISCQFHKEGLSILTI